jgi:hypothetical protein
MQQSMFPAPVSVVPDGYARFYPDVPTEIFLALGGAYAIGKVSSHKIFSSHNALQIDVCAQNGVAMVHVRQNAIKTYDIYFYNAEGACISYAYAVYHHELAGVFQAGTGLVTFKKKPGGPALVACQEAKAA